MSSYGLNLKIRKKPLNSVHLFSFQYLEIGGLAYVVLLNISVFPSTSQICNRFFMISMFLSSVFQYGSLNFGVR